MIQVGVVGTDGHGRSFTSAFNGVPGGRPNIEDARVTWVWGRDQGEARRFAGEFEVPNLAADPSDLLSRVDVVLILDDEGGGASHVRLATPFLKAGVPTFVDRPMTLTMADAIHLYDLAERHGAPLMTGSSLRYATEIAELREELSEVGAISSVVATGPGNWWYYGLHTVEMYQAVVGPGVEWVYRHALANRDVVVAAHRQGHTGVVQVLRDTRELFHIVVFGAEGHAERTVTDHWLEAGDAGPHTFRTRMMAAAVEMAKTGTPPTSRTEALEVLAILHAARSPAVGGGPVRVSDLYAAGTGTN